MPEVSVIIPIYNTAAYLRKALDSICGQTLKELEIILIDDGSTDGSRGIIEEYAERDARIRWYAQPNQGLSVARNRGLLHATGKYIYFMDSDDMLDTQALQRCHDLCRRKELDFVFLRCGAFGGVGRQPEHSPLWPERKNRRIRAFRYRDAGL